jgi:hypothetical protein
VPESRFWRVQSDLDAALAVVRSVGGAKAPIPRGAAVEPATALRRVAQQKLVQIRFLQTFSLEASGKVGIKALELASRTAASMAERPLTYPEIVADMRSFLELVAESLPALSTTAPDGSAPRVTIGIDELDRIGSGDEARAFLDAIKGVFLVPGCYFIVSVSEDALRAFELAGQGMRDAFDSAFDEVIRVEHLDFDGSSSLLRARVIGLPMPFHALGYCLSGGLPRELIRAARSIVEEHEPQRPVSLHHVAAKLVGEDVAHRCHAALLALGQMPEGAAAGELVRLLDEGRHSRTGKLRELANDLARSVRSEPDTVRALGYGIATSTFFGACLLEVFTDSFGRRLECRAEAGLPVAAQLETLARARRYLGVNDTFARALLDSFVADWTSAPAARLV